MSSSENLLEVDLCVDYPNKTLALRNVTFSMRAGEVLGLVGESGSGKSTIALALLRLLRWKGGRASGRIAFRGQDLLKASEKEMEKVRGQEIGLVLQSPTASLNPTMRIERQLAEAWRAHATGTRDELADAVKKALLRVGLPCDKEFRRRYSSHISVGQAQRVLIAMAVMHSPALVIADEPTSALDAMTQVETLNMLATLNRSMGSAILYISHDLQSVASICQRIAILRDGEIVECGDTEGLLLHPRHPYTQRLLACAPWLSWWLDETQRARRQPTRESPSESVAASVCATPEQLYGRLMSPGQPPMNQ